MKILKEGHQERTFCPLCKRNVVMRFEYWFYQSLGRKEEERIMVGACLNCGGIITIPIQSLPRIKKLRERKDRSIQARVPNQLLDVLHIVASRFAASNDVFIAALLRTYLKEFTDDYAFSQRVVLLIDHDLAQGRGDSRIAIRLRSGLLYETFEVMHDLDMDSLSMIIRGLILAAYEDVVLKKDSSRIDRLQNIADAVA